MMARMKRLFLHHGTAVGVLALLALAAWLRFYGITFGLPHPLCRPDENTIGVAAWRVVAGDLNPHFFSYPSLFIYAVAAAYRVFSLLTGCGAAGGAAPSNPPIALLLVARVLAATLGALTPLLVFLVARRCFGKATALAAAFLMSICYLHVRDSHFGVTDVPMTFFALAAVLLILRAYETRALRDYAWAGVLTGMATATKYGARVLGAPMLAAHLLAAQGRPLRALADCRLWLFGLLAVGAFLLCTPYALLDATTFLSDFTRESRHLADGHPVDGAVLILGRGLWYHARYTLPYGMGWALFLSGWGGLVAATGRDWRRALVLFLFPLAFYVTAGRGYAVFVRYMVPVLPYLCIGAAVLVRALAGRIATRPLAVGLTTGALTLLLAAASVDHAVRFDHILARRDNRLIAADWLRTHIPTGKTIAQNGSLVGQVLLDAPLTPFTARENHAGRRPDYMVIQRHPLRYTSMPDWLERELRADYHAVQTFQAFDPAAPGNWYDMQDAFYVPFVGFKGIQRPGPNFTVYERN